MSGHFPKFDIRHLLNWHKVNITSKYLLSYCATFSISRCSDEFNSRRCNYTKRCSIFILQTLQATKFFATKQSVITAAEPGNAAATFIFTTIRV